MMFYGAYSTYSTTLTSVSASFSASNMTWTKMLKYPKQTQSGDSGGMIWIGNLAYGVHRGGGLVINEYYAFATPSNTITQKMFLFNY